VHELSRDQPKTTKDLLDIATRHTSGEEVVGAIFVQSSGKAAPGSGWGGGTKAADKCKKSGARSDKRGPKQWPQGVTVATSNDECDNDKDTGDSDEELIAAAERDFKC
jgi:hypothetical protein